MKKMFLLATLLFLARFAGAQTENLKIVNMSSCTTYVALKLGDAGAPCSPSYSSSIIAVPPSTVLTYNYTTCPGVSSPAQYFNDAKVLDGDPTACGTTSVDVGDACVPASYNSATAQYNASCTLCGQANLTWTPDFNPTGMSVLEITP